MKAHTPHFSLHFLQIACILSFSITPWSYSLVFFFQVSAVTLGYILSPEVTLVYILSPEGLELGTTDEREHTIFVISLTVISFRFIHLPASSLLRFDFVYSLSQKKSVSQGGSSHVFLLLIFWFCFAFLKKNLKYRTLNYWAWAKIIHL